VKVVFCSGRSGTTGPDLAIRRHRCGIGEPDRGPRLRAPGQGGNRAKPRHISGRTWVFVGFGTNAVTLAAETFWSRWDRLHVQSRADTGSKKRADDLVGIPAASSRARLAAPEVKTVMGKDPMATRRGSARLGRAQSAGDQGQRGGSPPTDRAGGRPVSRRACRRAPVAQHGCHLQGSCARLSTQTVQGPELCGLMAQHAGSGNGKYHGWQAPRARSDGTLGGTPAVQAWPASV